MMMAVTKTSSYSHVAVIAFPFTSHPISLFSLVLRLARSSPDTIFTFLNSPKSNATLFKHDSIPRNLNRHDLHDGQPQPEDGLGPATELFYGALLQPGTLRGALDAAAIAGGARVTCLLLDALLSIFLADIAAAAELPWIAVWSPSPCALSAYVHIDRIRRECADAVGDIGEVALDFVPGLSGMRVSDHWPRKIILAEFDGNKSKFLHGLAMLGHALPRASAVVLNSFRELNPAELNLDMGAKFNEVLNVGFFTVDITAPPPQQLEADPTGCLAWLDSQEPGSVAYICFGTAAELSEEEIKAAAEALEESNNKGIIGVPFLWSLPDCQKKLLPGGFVERSSSRGYGKVVAWTDQARVLGHRSVGVHVTHCGLNSVNESVAKGVPLIARPFWADNHMNARMVEGVWETGIGVQGSVLTKRGLGEALEIVLKREEGAKMRERALAFKDLVSQCSSPSGSGTRDFNALLGLLSHPPPFLIS